MTIGVLVGFAGLTMLCGCAPLIRELKKPPFPYALTHHTRVVGIEATVPNQAGDAVFKLRLGFFSDVTTLLPCATNQVYAPPFSDRFKVGESGLDTTITEELNTGWKDAPPPPLMHKLFSPKETPPAPAHAAAFVQSGAPIMGSTVTISLIEYEGLKAAAGPPMPK